MAVAGIVGMGALLCLALWVYLTAPRIRRKWPDGILSCAFAHRGLHGGGIPENSLPAFELAAQKGYGIELDVRLTRDGCLAVHHDPTLKRTCGLDRAISGMRLEEIKACVLGSSGETVPTFQEALACVRGRAPLIVELKTAGKRNAELARKTYDALCSYGGKWVVESFDPRLMRWFRKNAPQAIRGQLAYDPRLGGPPGKGVGYWFLANLLMNCLSRPDFIAYCHETDRNLSFRMVRKLFHPVLVAWTVQSTEQYQKLQSRYDIQIFEGFEP